MSLANRSAFEWVVVNDGGDSQTHQLITQTQKLANLAVTYLEMEHPSDGFGLCHARNFGLLHASCEIVAYLDDDNTLKPNFVESTLKFFQDHPEIRYSMARQHRRRDIVRDGRTLKQGKLFLSPDALATAVSLIQQTDIFDSNGFAHYRHDAGRWNPNYRVFADYEFFLQCVSLWGCSSFKLNPEVLVNYVQSSEGIIGRSSYKDWVTELTSIYSDFGRYSALKDNEATVWFPFLIETYLNKLKNDLLLPGFN
jgi:glycosyltransferase involved in cell wall biosynthesis